MIEQKVKDDGRSSGGLILQLLLMALWGFQLINSDAYYVNYALLLVITGICTFINYQSKECVVDKRDERYKRIVLLIFSAAFSFMVSLSVKW